MVVLASVAAVARWRGLHAANRRVVTPTLSVCKVEGVRRHASRSAYCGCVGVYLQVIVLASCRTFVGLVLRWVCLGLCVALVGLGFVGGEVPCRHSSLSNWLHTRDCKGRFSHHNNDLRAPWLASRHHGRSSTCSRWFAWHACLTWRHIHSPTVSASPPFPSLSMLGVAETVGGRVYCWQPRRHIGQL